MGGHGEVVGGRGRALTNFLERSQGKSWSEKIGQNKKVNVYYPIFDKTIEEIIYKSLKSKQKNIDTIMGEYSEDVIIDSIIDELGFL